MAGPTDLKLRPASEIDFKESGFFCAAIFSEIKRIDMVTRVLLICIKLVLYF
jgi:hypothetical protein